MASPDPVRVDARPKRKEAVYLYCLAGGVDGPSLAQVRGVDGERSLSLISFRDVVAVTSAVDVGDFCGPTAEARMKDLAWVAPRACRHETIVETVMRASPVVPARFGTLFSSRDRLIAWLAIRHAGISRALGRLRGHEEWAVTGRLDRRTAEGPLLAAALARRAAPASPGARYLEERRIRAGIGQELNVWLQTVSEQIVRQLREHAVEFRERAAPPASSNADGVPVLNWAFLVSCDRVGDFRARVDRLTAAHAARGLALDSSGPWPPYSFCPALQPDDAE